MRLHLHFYLTGLYMYVLILIGYRESVIGQIKMNAVDCAQTADWAQQPKLSL